VPVFAQGMELSKELRETQRRLKTELLTSISTLTCECRTLAAMIADKISSAAHLQKQKAKANGALTSD
jgi:hypothetical protein